MCRPLTRRELLRYAGLVAATPIVGSALPRATALAASPAVPMHLELVTLTETSATFTWFTGNPLARDSYGRPEPVPADTVLELGTSPLTMHRVVDVDEGTAYHYVEVTGLEPGRPYFYRASSGGLAAVPTGASLGVGYPSSGAPLGTVTDAVGGAVGQFSTPEPPPGRHLFSIAWLNDLHIGELTSGLAISNSSLPGGGFPPGFPVDPADPYWRFMARAAVAEAKARGSSLMMVNGDLTSEAEPVHMAEARRTLDAFGSYREDYFVTRGNHDRAHSGATWRSCRPSTADPAYNDCLLDYFFPTGDTTFSFDHRRLHVVGLDTNDVLTGSGKMRPAQFDWLEADLAAHAGQPTFVFGHHPVTQEAAATAIPPVTFTLDQQDAERLESVVAAHRVVGVYSAHTHRNKRTYAPSGALGTGTPYIELGAVKEYPGGYGVVRVFTGGYAVNFHKTMAPAAREWSERSRGEYLGLYPYYTLGRLADRNFVVPADLSDLAGPPAGTPPAPRPPAAHPPAHPAPPAAVASAARATRAGDAAGCG